MSKLAPYRGRWALVTGAGDGIGRALILAFAREGVNAAVCDIRTDAAESVAAEARALGVEAVATHADVSDRASVVACADALAARGIVPSILWANAGVGAGAGLVDGSPRAIEWVVSVNVLGVAWTAQAFVSKMLAQGAPAHVGVTASSASIVDVKGPFTLYAATKHATAAFGEALAAELAPKNVGVTILYPGLLNTNIWDAARARPERFGGERRAPESTSSYWRKAASPDVLIDPVLDTIANGGGRCVVDTTGETKDLFEAKTNAIRAAFKS